MMKYEAPVVEVITFAAQENIALIEGGSTTFEEI